MGVPPINATPNPDSNSIRGADSQKLKAITELFKTVFLPTHSSKHSDSPEISLAVLSVAADPASIPIGVVQLLQAVQQAEEAKKAAAEGADPVEREEPREPQIDLNVNNVFAMLRLLYIPEVAIRWFYDSKQIVTQMFNPLYRTAERFHAGVMLTSLIRRTVGAFNVTVLDMDFATGMLAAGDAATRAIHVFSTGPMKSIVRPITNVVEGALGLVGAGIRMAKGVELRYQVPTLKGRSIENLTQTLKDLKKQLNVTHQEMFTEYTNKTKFKKTGSQDLDYAKINDALEKEADKRVLVPAKAFIKELQKNHSFEELRALFPEGVEAWKDFFEGKGADKKLSSSLMSFFNQFAETMDSSEKSEQKKLLCKHLGVDLDESNLNQLNFKSILALHMLRDEKLKIKQQKLGDVVGSGIATKLKTADTISLIAQMALPDDTTTAIKAKEVVTDLINELQNEMSTRFKKDLLALVTFSAVLVSAAIWLANPPAGALMVAAAALGFITSILFSGMDAWTLYEKLIESKLGALDQKVLMGSWITLSALTLVFFGFLYLSGGAVPIGVFASAIGGAAVWLAANTWIYRKEIEEKFQRGVANVQHFWQTNMGTIAPPTGYQPLLEGELEVREDDGKTQKILENMCLHHLDLTRHIASQIRNTELDLLLRHYSSNNEEFLRAYENDPLLKAKIAKSSQKQRASKGDRRLQNITDVAKAFNGLETRKQESLRKKFIREKTEEILDALSANDRFQLRHDLDVALIEESRKQSKKIIQQLGIVRPATP